MNLDIIDKKEYITPDNLQATKVFGIVAQAVQKGYSTVSCQGSSRSSKTYNILIFLIVMCLKIQNLSVSIVRSTLPAIKGSVFRDFKEILFKLGVFDEKRLNKTEMIYTFENGSFIEFFSTDSEQKLRGRKRHILFVNEANEILFIEWQQLKMRTTMFSIVDYNPSFSDDHWLCDLNKDERTFHFISTYKDNPFLEQTIIDEIESLQFKNKSLWRIYGLGLQSMVEGLVFPEVELIDDFPEWARNQALGLDFGFTNDPTAIIRCGVIDNNIYFDEICYRTRMLTGDIIKELKSFRLEVMAESADPRLIQEIANAGILIYPVQKGQGSVEAGILQLQQMKIHITKRSLNAIKESRNYTYLQDKDEKWTNKPIDKWNHFWDASRYYVLGKLLGKIQKPANLEGVFY